MQFVRSLHEGIRRGEITCTIRIWSRPHVKVGGRYQLDQGTIQVTTIRQISLADITPGLARQSGFKGVVDLLKTAKHGKGEKVYLITFHYQEPYSIEESMPINTIHVTLPYHLRTLANVGKEIEVQIEGLVTLGAILDAVEARYPMLCGTIRDQVTHQRRDFVRFFACGQDLSHVPADTPMPEAIVTGAEPLRVVGAMAGG